jgi:hypothetical protein
MRQYSRQPDEGAVGRIKGLLSGHVTQKRKAEKHLFAWLKKGKRPPAREKAPRIKKKELLTLTPGDDAEGRSEGDDDRSEQVNADHNSMWQYFRVLRVKHKKVGRQPNVYTVGGGVGSHPTPNHLIGKRTVNMTLMKGHHADLVDC